jgi:putative peptidoglycan lipid II flippase
MRKGATRVVTAVSLSRLAGLIRERIFAQYLGTSAAADAFGAAFRIPMLLEQVLGDRVFSSAFIPRYSRLLAEGAGAQAARLARTVAAIHVLIVSGIVVAGVLLAPLLVAAIAPGFDAATADLTVRLVRILFPTAGLLVLGSWCLGVLNSHRQFFLPYIVPVLSAAATSAGLLLAGRESGTPQIAEAAAWGALVGALLQVLAQLPLVVRVMEPPAPRSEGVRADLQAVGSNALPAAARGLLSRLGTWIEVAIAGFVSTGAIAALNYAQLLYSLPAGLFTVAISAALLPEISSASAQPGTLAHRLAGPLDSALSHTAYLLIGSAVAFIALGDVLVAAVYLGGRFGTEDVNYVWAILGASSIGIVGASMGGLHATAFYAIGDARTPFKASVIRLAVRAVLGVVLAIPVVRMLGIDPKWGAAGLGAAIGISGWIEFLFLRRWLRDRIALPATPGFVPYLIRLWAIAAIAAAVAWLVKLALPTGQPIARAAAVLGTYGVVYVGLTLAARMREPLSFLAQLRDVLRR